MFSCTQYDYTTPRKSNFNCHLKRHNDIPVAQILPPEIAHHEPIPNIIDPTKNEQLLQDIEHQELSDMLSSQVGFGVTQITPADESIPKELCDFFRDEQPWGTDRNLPQVYVRNFHRIHDSEALNLCSRIFFRYLRHDFAPLIESIAQALENIFQCQTNAFKINISFSFILQHRETGEFRYHYASNNNQLLNSHALFETNKILTTFWIFLPHKIFHPTLKVNVLTPNGSLNALSVFVFILS